MGKVSFLAAQVPAAPTYNWTPVDPTLGLLDFGLVTTDAPGPGPASTGIQNVATSVLPRPIFEPMLGQIVRAWEPTLGFGEFIYLAVPTSTAVPLGTVCSWDVSATAQYLYVIMPVIGTAKNSGAPAAVCISSTAYNSGAGITSNTTAVQYAWFQIGGNAQVLKTAIQVAPVTSITASNGVYLAATAGRIKAISSAGGQILGARFSNTTTVTSTASCILVYLNGRPVVEGA